MGLETVVEDWAAVKQRWTGWWEGELYDRVLLSITAPRQGVAPPQGLAVDPVTQWNDAAYMIHRTEEALRTTYYGGEALPWCWNPISAGHALYFGCRPHFRADTMWAAPAPDGPDGYPVLEGWHESPWWHLARASTTAFAQASRGRFFVPPFWGNHEGDILAVVRGVERFYMDFVLHRDWLKRAIEQMGDILIEVHETLERLAPATLTGVEGWLSSLGSWSPRKSLAFDCDISCNLSSADFAALILPPMRRAMQAVERSIYHLDGPRALHHLDTLLDLPELHAIQWVPGAGQEAILPWVPLIQHIQARGKALILYCTPAEVEPLLDAVRPEGICLGVACANEGEARALIERVAQRKG